jgi:hypothetical protein
MIRAAKGQSERWGVGAFSRVQLDRSKEDAEQPAYSAGPIKHL